LESRRNAISVLDFPPQARNPTCFVFEFREVFQLFPVRGDTPEVPGRVDWFLMDGTLSAPEEKRRSILLQGMVRKKAAKPQK